MSEHRTRIRHRFFVARPVDSVFALFDPIAEKGWVPGWNPIPVHPNHLSLESGSVFFLEREDRKEVWTILDHDPARHHAEYLSTSPDYQQRWISVSCSEKDQGTEVHVEYRVTALSPRGLEDMANLDQGFIEAWEEPVAKALGINQRL